jgi:hypothetical protein
MDMETMMLIVNQFELEGIDYELRRSVCRGEYFIKTDLWNVRVKEGLDVMRGVRAGVEKWLAGIASKITEQKDSCNSLICRAYYIENCVV